MPPRKRKEQPKRTRARDAASSNARRVFLFQFQKVRDASAAETRAELSACQQLGEFQQRFSVHVDRLAGTLPALFASYAEERCDASELEQELNGLGSNAKSEVRNWIALACDGELPDADWHAPATLAGWPSKLEPTRYHMPVRTMGEKLKSDAEGRLSAVAAEKVIAGVASRLEDQIAMANMAARNHAEKWAAEQKRQRIENIFRHSADYRSITYKGRNYHLTAFHAAIVRRLHEAYLRGTPELSQAYILTAVASDTRDSGERLRDYFKRSNSDLWGKDALIVRGTTKGTLRLNLPPLPRIREKPI